MGAQVRPMMSSRIYLVLWNMYLYSLADYLYYLNQLFRVWNYLDNTAISFIWHKNPVKMSVSAYGEGFGMPYKMIYWQEYYLMKHTAKKLLAI